MKTTNIGVSVGATINLGNFESLRLDYSAEALLDDGDDAPTCYDKLRNGLVKKIRETLIATNGGKELIK